MNRSVLNTTSYVGIDEHHDTNILNTTPYVGIDEHHDTGGYARLVALPVGLFALLENLVIIIMLLSVSKLRRRAHVFFVLCLSFSDLLFSISITIFGLLSLVFDTRLRVVCCFQYIMLHISFATSLIVTLLICLERFKSIHGNIVNTSYFDEKKYFVVILAWVLSITYMMVSFLAVPQNQQESTMPTSKCTIDDMYTDGSEEIIYASLSVLYIPFIALVLVFYTITAIKIRRRLSRTFLESTALKVSTINAVAGTSTKTENFLSDTRYDHPRLKKPTTASRKGGKLTTSDIGHSSYEDISKTCVNIPAKKAITILGSVPTTTKDRTSSYHQKNEVMRIANHNMFKSATRSRHMNNALVTVTLIVVIYVICLGPGILSFFIRCFSTVKAEISLLTNSLACLNAVMNPMLYVWRFADLRKEMKLKCSKVR